MLKWTEEKGKQARCFRDLEMYTGVGAHGVPFGPACGAAAPQSSGAAGTCAPALPLPGFFRKTGGWFPRRPL